MGRQTLAELKQTRPFESLEVEAYVSLLRTADALLRGVEAALKGAGLSPTQYNVLRILRGAGRNGLSCREIAERMITRDPDITRLLDRLESRGLIARARGALDRRVMLTRISSTGLRLLKSLDQPLLAAHKRQLGHLGAARLQRLVGLLEKARAATR
jgi:DNA-binding MarR family transcriptional regulator